MIIFKQTKTALTLRQGLAVAAMALALPMTAISTGNAFPAASAPALSSAAGARGITQVQWGGHRGGGWGHRGGWGYRGGGWGGVGAGLAAGALIGGAIAASSYPYGYSYGPGYYYAPAPVYAAPVDDDGVAYCMQRYRSYDPRSGTYLNYDGNRYPCP